MIKIENIGIVIQGTLYNNFCVDRIIESYSCIKDNCVISTWVNEPIELLDKLENAGFKVIKSDIPVFKGHHNCNLQTKSSINGIKYLENKDYSHILRMRSDLIPNDIIKLIDILSKISESKMVFLCWINGYNIHYFTDFFNFGPIEIIKKFWDVEQLIDEDTSRMFTEQYLCYKFTGLEYPNYNDISNIFAFSVKELYSNNIELNWTKPTRNWGEEVKRTMTELYNEILHDYI